MKKSLIMRGMYCLHYLVMATLFLGFWHFFYRVPALNGLYPTHSIAACSVYLMSLYILSRLYTAYSVGLLRSGELIYNQVIANLVSLGMTYVLSCILALRILNPIYGFIAAAVQTLFSAGWTATANKLYFHLHKPKRTLVIYRNQRDLEKLSEIQFFENRWTIAKTCQCSEGYGHDLPDMDPSALPADPKAIHELIPLMAEYEVIFVSGVNATLRNGIVKYCVEAGKDCFFVPHTGDVITSGASHVRSFSVPIFRVRRSAPTPEFLFIKRAFDIVLSLTAILILLPFMAITAVCIKCYDRGPVLYKQVRLTKDGKQFKILKFRSMRMDAEKDGVARLASAHDDRITPIGKVIRAIRFDELPQLFNILAGDMSIVGPRPERPEIAAQYLQELPAFDLRLQVKAGLTGYAQVYGRYNTEPTDKLKMDLMYINNLSVMEDLKLIFATVRILFMKESTSGIAEGQSTALQETNPHSL